MRRFIVPILLLGAVACATALYAERREYARDTEMTPLENALRGVDKILPASARIAFRCPGNDAPLYARCRYLLAPRYLDYTRAERLDTLLEITNANGADAAAMPVSSGRRMLWQHADGLYHYYLTCSL